MFPLCQDQEKDSSDEEWEIAYAEMDPLSLHRWEHMRGEEGGGAAQMVRDVFLAADVVHEDAMSQMDAASQNEEDCDGNMEIVREELTSTTSEGSERSEGSDQGNNDNDGEHLLICKARTRTSICRVAYP